MSDMPLLCGVQEMLGDGSPALKLATNRPLVLVRDALPNHSRDELWSWLKEAHARWGSVCDWQARRIHDESEIGPNDYVNFVTAADLGGGGVLADQVLPYRGGRVLRMRINIRPRWKATDGPMAGGTVDPIRTLCHEIGHFMGHSHWPVGAPAELMEPTVSQRIIGPQPTEGRVSAGWFGPPGAVPVPPSPPSPPSPQPPSPPSGGFMRELVTMIVGAVLNAVAAKLPGFLGRWVLSQQDRIVDAVLKAFGLDKLGLTDPAALGAAIAAQLDEPPTA
jgi:hypothetical protein